MRRTLTSATAILLIVLAGLAGAQTGAAATERTIAAACAPMQVVGVRGSGELRTDYSGFGRTVWSVVDGVQHRVPGALVHAIDYPAIEVGYGGWNHYRQNYRESVAAGTKTLRDYINDFVAGACGSTTFLYLVGYSQGAHVAGDVYSALPGATRARVAGLVLIGDPRFRGGQGQPVNIGDYNPRLSGIAPAFGMGTTRSFASVEAGKIRSYCTKGDPICNYSAGNLSGCKVHESTCSHIRYPEIRYLVAPYTTLAATFLAARWRAVGPKPPPIGTGTRVLLYGDNDTTDNDPTGMPNLTAALAAAAYQVTTAATLPADLSAYDQVWHYGILDVPSAADQDRLVAFAQAGGSVLLSGEWEGCCSSPPANDAVRAVFDRLVVTVGGLSTGPDGYDTSIANPVATDSAATVPNVLSTFSGALVGSIDPGNVAASSLLTRSDPHSTAGYGTIGLWNDNSVVGGGRLAIVMDVNWAQTGFGDMTTMPLVAQNLAYFLSHRAATPRVVGDFTPAPVPPSARSDAGRGPRGAGP